MLLTLLHVRLLEKVPSFSVVFLVPLKAQRVRCECVFRWVWSDSEAETFPDGLPQDLHVA